MSGIRFGKNFAANIQHKKADVKFLIKFLFTFY